MNKIAWVILVVLIGFSASAKGRKHKKQQRKDLNEMTAITVFRTGCFGRCPTYNVEINKNGMATYTAVRFNADSGVFQKNIGIAKAAGVLAEINNYRPDTCKDVYNNEIPDLPNMNFEIVYTNRTKKIYSAKFGPLFLQRIAKLIDDAGKKTDEIGWQRADEAKK